MKLIRTGLRDKLSEGLSYPVGAEVISTALIKVPQYHSLWISFSRTGWMSIGMAEEINDLTNFMRAFSVVQFARSGLLKASCCIVQD
jgi:hypothetical protein